MSACYGSDMNANSNEYNGGTWRKGPIDFIPDSLAAAGVIKCINRSTISSVIRKFIAVVANVCTQLGQIILCNGCKISPGRGRDFNIMPTGPIIYKQPCDQVNDRYTSDDDNRHSVARLIAGESIRIYQTRWSVSSAFGEQTW